MRIRLTVLGVLLTLIVLAFLSSGGGSVNFSEASGSPFSVEALRPKALALGDFNNDGKQDLAVASLKCDPDKDPRATCTTTTKSGQVSILVGDGAGKFSEFIESETKRSPFAVAGSPASIAVADFDGDGNDDFATVHPESDKVTVRRGNGNVDFYRATQIIVQGAPSAIAIADLNRDGKQDIATANMKRPKQGVSILLGDGTGNFGSPAYYPTSANAPRSVVIADFNKDSNQDIATANASEDESISIWLGDGKGKFGTATSIGIGEVPSAIATADFNGDGNPDLATANTGSNTVSILLGDGSGGFGQATDFSAGTDPIAIVINDFDGDRKKDIVVVSGNKNSLTILLGDGTGRFTLAGTFSVGKVPLSVAVGDFNRDRKPDLATANQASNNVTILLNN